MRQDRRDTTAKRLLGATAVATTALVALFVPAAHATDPGHAVYHGRDIDLAVSWEGAAVCAVVTPTDTRCYDSQAEADADLATVAGAGSTSSLSGADSLDAACGGDTSKWVYLYADANYGGRVLQFQDTGSWQDLATWGFDNQLSSWRNTTACTATVAQNTQGGGSHLSLGAGGASSYVGDAWNDQASSLFIG